MKLITRAEYEDAYCIVKKYQEQVTEEANKVKWEYCEVDKHYVSPNTRIEDLDITVRLMNILRRWPEYILEDAETLRDLSKIRLRDWRKCRGFGKSTERELCTQLKYANLTLQ